MAHRKAEVQLHLFLTSTLDSVSGQLHTPAALPPLNTEYDVGGLQSLMGIFERENLMPLPGAETLTFQPVT